MCGVYLHLRLLFRKSMSIEYVHYRVFGKLYTLPLSELLFVSS